MAASGAASILIKEKLSILPDQTHPLSRRYIHYQKAVPSVRRTCMQYCIYRVCSTGLPALHTTGGWLGSLMTCSITHLSKWNLPRQSPVGVTFLPSALPPTGSLCLTAATTTMIFFFCSTLLVVLVLNPFWSRRNNPGNSFMRHGHGGGGSDTASSSSSSSCSCSSSFPLLSSTGD